MTDAQYNAIVALARIEWQEGSDKSDSRLIAEAAEQYTIDRVKIILANYSEDWCGCNCCTLTRIIQSKIERLVDE